LAPNLGVQNQPSRPDEAGSDVTSGSLRVEVGGYPIPLAADSSDDGVITDILKGDDNS
jgi:hypothetical protein